MSWRHNFQLKLTSCWFFCCFFFIIPLSGALVRLSSLWFSDSSRRKKRWTVSSSNIEFCWPLLLCPPKQWPSVCKVFVYGANKHLPSYRQGWKNAIPVSCPVGACVRVTTKVGCVCRSKERKKSYWTFQSI